MRRVASIASALVMLVVACTSSTIAPGPAPSDASVGSASPTPRPNFGKVTFAVGGLSFSNSILYLAIREKFFEEQGFSSVEVSVLNGAQVLAAVLGGSVDVGSNGMSELLEAAKQGPQGQRARALLLHYQGWPAAYLASTKALDDMQKAGVTPQSPLDSRIKALKGRVIALSAPSSSADTIMRLLLKSGGLDPEKDVKITYVGNTDNVAAALAQGTADVGVASQPGISTLTATGKAKVFLYPAKDDPRYQKLYYSGFDTVLNSAVDANPERYRAIVRALLKSRDLMLKDPDGSATKVASFFPLVDPAIALAAFKGEYAALTAEPFLRLDDAQAAITEGGATGLVQPENLVRIDIGASVQKERTK